MNRHLTAEEVGALAEGSADREQAESYRAHLAGCAGCAAAFAHAVRYRAAWLGRREWFEIPAEVSAELARDSGPGPAVAPTSGRRWLPAAAVATAIVAVGAWALLSPRASPTFGLSLPPATRATIEASSSRELVLPGGERYADHASREMRSGAAAGSAELTAEVSELTAHYEGGDRSADASARLVTTLIAVGDLGAANAYAREALRGHPRDVRLLVLMADLHYRSSELDTAERILRSAAQIAPRDPLIGLDLALVLRERGDAREAREWFERVAASRTRPLSERARQELRR